MLLNASTTSNLDDTFTVLVEYGNQVKPINITQNDDLFSIERKIYEWYNFNTEQRRSLQIQWYDNDFKSFIDLDSETWLKYVRNRIHTNSSKDLKLVHKYLPQQPNDVTVIPKTPAHQTSGTTEDRIRSELERMNQSIHTDWVLNGLVATFAHIGDALLVIFATATVICENLEFIYDHRAQDEQDQKREEYYHRIAVRFLYASNATKVFASLSCYALILLQFFSKADKRKD